MYNRSVSNHNVVTVVLGFRRSKPEERDQT